MRFVDRTVVVTGAGSGIGRAAARAFAAEGARVVVGDLDPARADAVAAEVGGVAVGGDLRDSQVIDTLVGAADGVSAVFGNAGILRTAALEALNLEEFQLHLEVNLIANLRLVQRVAPVMRARGGGAIVFTASLGGLRGSAGSASYNASKGALVNLTRSLADELGPAGVRVNALCPGWIDTPFNDPFWAHAGAQVQDEIVGRIPLRRQGTPEDVAPAALFLASDDAAYITGQTLIVDGGVQAT